jgi:hypothetical protein
MGILPSSEPNFQIRKPTVVGNISDSKEQYVKRIFAYLLDPGRDWKILHQPQTNDKIKLLSLHTRLT